MILNDSQFGNKTNTKQVLTVYIYIFYRVCLKIFNASQLEVLSILHKSKASQDQTLAREMRSGHVSTIDGSMVRVPSKVPQKMGHVT